MGVPVLDTYGATEYAPIAAECRFGRKHLFEDGAIIEIIDESGRPVAPGTTGDRILLTVLDRRTQPLIRYELSDQVRPLADGCECGRPFRLIESIEGRIEDVLYFPHLDGLSPPVAIHPNVFHAALELVPATGWQVQQTNDGLAVSLVGLNAPSAINGIEPALRDAIAARGAACGPIVVRTVATLRRGATGKAPLILARRDAASS